MPDLSGMSRAAAQGLVRGRGLVPVAAESTLTDAVAKDAVVSFLPAAGATVERGDTVRLTWSWGRKTCPECRTVRKGAARFCTKCGYSF
jgi:beta-lactam-binding protein with PASTA domain